MLGGIAQHDTTYTITNKEASDVWWTSANFNGIEYLKAQEDQRAEKELRAPSYAGFPAVGYMTIKLQDISLEGANPKNSLYILVDNTGREIYRANGQNTIPDYTVSQSSYSTSTIWTAIDIIRLDDTAAEFPLTLRVVRLGREPVDITISKSGQ
jgi:hypothetical protein